jgi:hypothetical protein
MSIAAGTSVIIQETSFGGITSETFNPFRPVEVGRAVDGGVDGKLPYAV